MLKGTPRPWEGGGATCEEGEAGNVEQLQSLFHLSTLLHSSELQWNLYYRVTHVAATLPAKTTIDLTTTQA